MTPSLPDEVRSFWYAMCELGEWSERTPWGIVAADSRFPLVWEANLGCVMEPMPDLAIEEVEAAVRDGLARSGGPYEHLEFWETSVVGPALDAARARAERHGRDAVMTFDGRGLRASPPDPGGAIEVDEVRTPGGEFWPWLRDSVVEYGTPLSDPVLDQLVERFRSVLVPAGLRWFVARVDGERAGYAGLISLEGVGYVEGVVTMPAFRRRGVASATVSRAVEASRRAGDRAMFLLTDPEGGARRLYERLGFRVAAEVEGCTRRLAEGWPPPGG
jgi:ribosomal protein S18 acetylase RimI-like enzyme